MTSRQDEDAHEREEMARVSPDVALELQSKLFEQLATLSLGGTGLVITLAGSLLQDMPLVWLAAVEFGLAAVVALTAQTHVIEAIFKRTPQRRRSRLMTAIAIGLIGMGSGSLGMTVYLDGKDRPADAAAAR